MGVKLSYDFYRRSEVTTIAKDLLGMILCTRIDRLLTTGIIVETEAYSQRERGCHSFRGPTHRNQVMFHSGGHAYVYICYGIHHLFNIVTHAKGVGDAVLVRAVEPLEGIQHMQDRIHSQSSKKITSGPGKLTKAMGIRIHHNGVDLHSNVLWIEEGRPISSDQVRTTKRIGLGSAGEDAHLMWRYVIQNNVWVSKK